MNLDTAYKALSELILNCSNRVDRLAADIATIKANARESASSRRCYYLTLYNSVGEELHCINNYQAPYPIPPEGSKVQYWGRLGGTTAYDIAEDPHERISGIVDKVETFIHYERWSPAGQSYDNIREEHAVNVFLRDVRIVEGKYSDVRKRWNEDS